MVGGDMIEVVFQVWFQCQVDQCFGVVVDWNYVDLFVQVVGEVFQGEVYVEDLEDVVGGLVVKGMVVYYDGWLCYYQGQVWQFFVYVLFDFCFGCGVVYQLLFCCWEFLGFVDW